MSARTYSVYMYISPAPLLSVAPYFGRMGNPRKSRFHARGPPHTPTTGHSFPETLQGSPIRVKEIQRKGLKGRGSSGIPGGKTN